MDEHGVLFENVANFFVNGDIDRHSDASRKVCGCGGKLRPYVEDEWFACHEFWVCPECTSAFSGSVRKYLFRTNSASKCLTLIHHIDDSKSNAELIDVYKRYLKNDSNGGD